MGPLQQAARNLVDEWRSTGYSVRCLPTRTDALVVEALVRACLRREGLTAHVARTDDVRVAVTTEVDDVQGHLAPRATSGA